MGRNTPKFVQVLVPLEVLSGMCKFSVVDQYGDIVWQQLFDSQSHEWSRWAAVQRECVKPRSRSVWDVWTESVASGNRYRVGRLPAGMRDSHKSRLTFDSAGWVQAASRMATTINNKERRLRRNTREPWKLWAETVGSNSAKRNKRCDSNYRVNSEEAC